MDTSLTELKKIVIVRALALIASGHTQEEACQIAGISVDTLTRARKNNPNLISSFIAEKRDEIIQEYEDAATAHKAVRNAIYQEALKPDLPIDKALVLEARIRKMLGNMESQLTVVGEDNKPKELPSKQQTDAQNFLAKLQPRQKHAQGKAIIQQTTTTVELEFDDDNDDEAIDAVVTD